ncbi:MAG: Txe/YoeB family addiction module toxin [Bacteroidales bacterium]
MFELKLSEIALKGALKLKKSEPAAYKKLNALLEELKEHPFAGTGHPEQLKGMSTSTWSRRISSKHRLVYTVLDEEITVFVMSALGHYDDK